MLGWWWVLQDCKGQEETRPGVSEGSMASRHKVLVQRNPLWASALQAFICGRLFPQSREQEGQANAHSFISAQTPCMVVAIPPIGLPDMQTPAPGLACLGAEIVAADCMVANTTAVASAPVGLCTLMWG